MAKYKETVVVGMSGGVDSSVTAYLLKEQGYNVLGLTMKIWPSEKDKENNGGNYSLSSLNDAQRVADKLGIPFFIWDLREMFEREVIEYFVKEYLEGRTPNPCIVCNKKIKFEAFLKKAKALGAQYIATGHYAKIVYDNSRKRYLLKKSEDKLKDQTYFLYDLNQKQMEKTLFPLGEYTKKEIREIAENIGLKVANKPDSQEICFIPDNDYKNFLEKRVGKEKFKPGPFMDMQGNVVGTHKGISYYTVGQRKGLGLALGYPVYVVKIDPKKNAVIVGKDEEVYGNKLLAENNNFIFIDKLEKEMEVDVKIRYTARPAKAVIKPYNNERVLVEFKEPQRAITPGQAVVYYNGEYVVGGGTILEGF